MRSARVRAPWFQRLSWSCDAHPSARPEMSIVRGCRGRVSWRRRPGGPAWSSILLHDEETWPLQSPPRPRAPRTVQGPWVIPATSAAGSSAAEAVGSAASQVDIIPSRGDEHDETLDSDSAAPLCTSPPKLGQLPKESPTQLRKGRRRSSSTASVSSSSSDPPPSAEVTTSRNGRSGATPTQLRVAGLKNGSSSGGGGGGGGGAQGHSNGHGKDISLSAATAARAATAAAATERQRGASARHLRSTPPRTTLAAPKPQRPRWGGN